jgi:hypothetical protein
VIKQARLHPLRFGLSGLALLGFLLTATYVYASYRTYFWLLIAMGDEHLIIPPDSDAIYRLRFHSEQGDRCTYNFWKAPLWLKRGRVGRYARLEFTNVPPELVPQLQVRFFADIPALPDKPKTPPLTNGQILYGNY